MATTVDPDEDLVRRVGEGDPAAIQAMEARKLPVAVDVSRAGQQLFHAALAGTTADNDHWIARKNAVVMRFGHSSYYMGRRAAFKGAPPLPRRGYARLFHDHVQGADTGADFDFLTGRRGHEVPRDSH